MAGVTEDAAVDAAGDASSGMAGAAESPEPIAGVTEPAIDAEVASLAAHLLEASDADNEEVTATAVAAVFERVKEMAAENDALRASLSDERTARLGLLEKNRELEWRVKTGVGTGAPVGAVTTEWEEAESKLTLLLAENNELEARERHLAEELQREHT
jgi:hypothetical protein